MSDAFRDGVADDLAKILDYWRDIELWIKRSEQISGRALIPAINELRYASRQLFNAFILLGRDGELSEDEQQTVTNRLVVARQYLHNADHDICDAVVGFYKSVIGGLDTSYGPTTITMLFPEYPRLKQTIVECDRLIADSRRDYDARANNYGTLKVNHFPQLIDSYAKLVDAEVSAKEEKERIEVQLRRVEAKAKLYGIITLAATAASLIAIPLSIYLWVNTPQDFCKVHKSGIFAGMLCSIGSFSENSSANTPSIDAKPAALTKPQ